MCKFTEKVSNFFKNRAIQVALIGKKLRAVKTKIGRLPGDKKKVLNRNLAKQNELRKQIKEINKKLMDIPREVSRIELLIREEYVKLNFMPKTFMDAIKITTRNIIYRLLEIFRPIWNNYRNDISFKIFDSATWVFLN